MRSINAPYFGGAASGVSSPAPRQEARARPASAQDRSSGGTSLRLKGRSQKLHVYRRFMGIMCFGSGRLPQESMPPTPICAASMQKSVSSCCSSSPACLTFCWSLSSGPSKSSRLYRWHCMPKPPPGASDAHAAISNPGCESPWRSNAIHLVSSLFPFSCGRTYLTVCSKMGALHKPTRADDCLSTYASWGPRPSHVTSSKPSTNRPRSPTLGGGAASWNSIFHTAAFAELAVVVAAREPSADAIASCLPDPSKASNFTSSPLPTCPSPATRKSFQTAFFEGVPAAHTGSPCLPGPVPRAEGTIP
mmetsp:Transcript_29326/g.84278  ORF Transcript_29326/g.84278 Transcript_29326/m.84278 type:complete len:305 (-) Transcript_29326:3141-4055(-)